MKFHRTVTIAVEAEDLGDADSRWIETGMTDGGELSLPDGMSITAMSDWHESFAPSEPVAEPGCYFDSHRGHYIVPDIIRLAVGYGRPQDSNMAELLARYDQQWHEPGFPNELVIEESEAAIQWLNDYRRPEGHWWGWNDGDFGLYELENDDEEV